MEIRSLPCKGSDSQVSRLTYSKGGRIQYPGKPYFIPVTAKAETCVRKGHANILESGHQFDLVEARVQANLGLCRLCPHLVGLPK